MPLRLTALLLSFALIQPSLGIVSHACPSHEAMAGMEMAQTSEMAQMAEMSHAGMSTTDMDDMSMPGDCDRCAPPAEEPPPCDHGNMSGECATMPSCATAAAEVQSSSFAALKIVSVVSTTLVQSRGSLTRPPEPPPPRA